ncbi:DUF4312 family protein [Lactococcus ileimucosae]|uniref:DUF4312 family protein n=1 Tax=Lactococcus ileimucosae TaxID=2941329 RepID=UPI0020441BE6|nr:DUF4312 family protein [Lactococcus ileimucosae]
MLKVQRRVVVEGKGNSKKAAFASALNKIQGEIIKNNEDVLLRIEPNDIRVLKAQKREWTEKFFFFFMPRQKEEYQVTLEVLVDLQIIEMATVNFTETRQEVQGIKIPIINKVI